MKMYNSAILYFVLICGLFFSESAFSQRSSITGRKFKPNSFQKRKPMNYINHFAYNAQLGLGNYRGDLCDGFDCFLPLPSVGIGVQYRFSESLMFRSNLNYVRMYANDRYGKYPYRGLSFYSHNLDFSVDVVYDIFEFNKMYRRRKTISPYISIGIGLVTVNPKVKYNGEKYSLRPLQTEGVDYNALALTIPYGIGARKHLTPHTSVAVELNLRYVFSDYLDDVSGMYDNSKKDLPDDDISKILSDRREAYGREKKDLYKGIRGNPGAKDSFAIGSIKLCHTFKVTRQRYNINSHSSKFRLIRSIQTK